jgi:hypothetical protein
MGNDTPNGGELILYVTEDGQNRVECRFAGETLWLTQAGMAELFQTTPQNITQHLRAIYAEGELSPEATCKESLQVRSEGDRSVKKAEIEAQGQAENIRLLEEAARMLEPPKKEEP